MTLIILALFKSAAQDKQDRDTTRAPTEETYCARHIIQVLNKVDPNLVKRGRYVTPKSLEAGMREATQPKKIEKKEQDVADFEALIAEASSSLPPFRLCIIPKAGREFLMELIRLLDREIDRLNAKRTPFHQQKATKAAAFIDSYRDELKSNHPISTQVDKGLELLAKTLPIFKEKKSGWFTRWFPSTSYKRIRAYARTQGIFDGDVRLVQTKLQQMVLEKEQLPLSTVEPSSLIDHLLRPNTGKVHIFSDWSFVSWPIEKQKKMAALMREWLRAGDALFSLQGSALIPMDENLVEQEILRHNIESDFPQKITPTTHSELNALVTPKGLNDKNIHFVDFNECRMLSNDEDTYENCLEQSAYFFSSIDPLSIKQTKLVIIDKEIENTPLNTDERAQWLALRHKIESQVIPTGYQSGIDTLGSRQKNLRDKPLFKSLSPGYKTPSSNYYRLAAYDKLEVNEAAANEFNYFGLQDSGLNSPDRLVACDYHYHEKGISKKTKKTKKACLGDTAALFEGKKDITLNATWQAIPSLHPQEVLSDVVIEGLKENQFEIRYNESTHLYFIRLQEGVEPKTYPIHFLLSLPKHYKSSPLLNTLNLPINAEIKTGLLKYFKFGRDKGELSSLINQSITGGHQYLEAARKLSVGSCRLRAIAFKEEMQRLYPEIPVNVVVNPSHCFIEMQLDSQWHSFCLGGYRQLNNVVDKAADALLACSKNSLLLTPRNSFFSCTVERDSGMLCRSVNPGLGVNG